MLAELFEVKETANKGKGLYARQRVPKGTIICFESAGYRVIPAEEYETMSESAKEHVYRRDDGTYIAPSDDSKYFNHSCDANVLDSRLGFDIVVKDIQKGKEVTYDYRAFSFKEMQCHCGAKNCCKFITYEHPVPEKLRLFWAKKVDSALRQVNKVTQPLQEKVRYRIGVNE
ncbi:MAG: SET domain-containing protein-lysine N-methyltransferase [Methanoregula sp.]|nr:SET domain-containing protein-lysine N-methyltransferase [Methanoregula sp.]